MQKLRHILLNTTNVLVLISKESSSVILLHLGNTSSVKTL